MALACRPSLNPGKAGTSMLGPSVSARWRQPFTQRSIDPTRNIYDVVTSLGRNRTNTHLRHQATSSTAKPEIHCFPMALLPERDDNLAAAAYPTDCAAACMEATNLPWPYQLT